APEDRRLLRRRSRRRSRQPHGSDGAARDRRPRHDHRRPRRVDVPADLPARLPALDVTWAQTRRVRRQSLRERLRVLLFGRVLVVSVFLAAAGSLTLLGRPREIGALTFWVVAAAYAGTIASALLVRRVARAELLAYLQVVFD